MKLKLAKFVRVITTVPIMAAAMLTAFYFLLPESFSGPDHYFCALLFLVVLPILAYPVSWVVPCLRQRGRDGQRTLAIFFSLAGYLAGVVFYLAADGTKLELLIYLTYLLSGIATALFSAAHIKSSGHACGVAGPITMLAVGLSPLWALGYLILLAVFWSSLVLRRHTLPQLLLGSVIPIVILLILSLCLGLL